MEKQSCRVQKEMTGKKGLERLAPGNVSPLDARVRNVATSDSIKYSMLTAFVSALN